MLSRHGNLPSLEASVKLNLKILTSIFRVRRRRVFPSFWGSPSGEYLFYTRPDALTLPHDGCPRRPPIARQRRRSYGGAAGTPISVPAGPPPAHSCPAPASGGLAPRGDVVNGGQLAKHRRRADTVGGDGGIGGIVFGPPHIHSHIHSHFQKNDARRTETIPPIPPSPLRALCHGAGALVRR